VSVTPQANGRIQVLLGNQSVVSDQTVDRPATVPSTFAAGGGQLGALQTLTATTLPGYLSTLDQFASTLATDVNAAYGSTFFGGSTALTLGTGIPTATAITAGSGTGAASNDLAMAVAALSTTSTAGSQYSAFVSQVGADTDDALRAQSVAQAAVDNAEDRRQNVSGVSLDEEMADMLRFQRGYQASARVMSTIDDMLDTLINRAGRVGL
jgi:flagellar hook-associated protein 1 FlgK